MHRERFQGLRLTGFLMLKRIAYTRLPHIGHLADPPGDRCVQICNPANQSTFPIVFQFVGGRPHEHGN